MIIKYVHLLIETDRRLAPFTILGLEKHVSMPWGDTKVGGIIDRLDSVTDPATGQERIRVIDYKTGARHLRPMPDIDAIFDPAQISNHSDYYLQAFLYSPSPTSPSTATASSPSSKRPPMPSFLPTSASPPPTTVTVAAPVPTPPSVADRPERQLFFQKGRVIAE